MYLWQRGVALYYLGRHAAAAIEFLRSAAAFEARFDEPATDERVWAAAALLRAGADDPPAAAAAALPVPCDAAAAAAVVAATLAAAGADADRGGDGGDPTARDITGRRFFGHFYLALWHEAHGRDGDARDALAAAVATGFPAPPGGERGDDVWLHLPRLHARLRGW
ncbi:unnamed protein product, partial [Phaeothamnion confervicola]